MSNNPPGLYLHVPYCLQKCRYCDFYSLAGRRDTDAYTAALCREVEAEGHRLCHPEADTVYFGGGTPTLLGADHLIRILDALRTSFRILPGAEITFEMNPATADRQALRRLRQAGFTRVSLGVQSTCEAELRTLGRVHTARQAQEAAEMICAAGFADYSIDVMYALPGQTPQSFARTLREVLALAPAHISAYGLILEPGTPLYRERDTLALPDEEQEYALYVLCAAMLADAGFCHYEISNYALPGHECRHNLKYWKRQPYLGFGPAAHSLCGSLRYQNRADLDGYLHAPLAQRQTEEQLSPSAEAEEYVMLGLRTAEGISLSQYRKMAGRSLVEGRERFISDCRHSGYLTQEEDRLALTEKGFYVSNAIIAEFLSHADE